MKRPITPPSEIPVPRKSPHILKRVMLMLVTASILSMLIVACRKGRSESAEVPKSAYEDRKSQVNVIVLERTDFPKEIVSNGKLKAARKSDLRFRVAGEITDLNVRNGSLVKAGETIAMIDQFEYLQRLEQAKTNVKRTSIEFEDALIAYGGSTSREALPEAIRENAAIRTGYVAAQSELESAKFNLAHTVLKAPFAGKIANLKQREYEIVNTGDVFCTLIDDAAFEVEFHLIESEIGEVAVNDAVHVIPFSTQEVSTGRVTEINPLIDENGLVRVKALVKNDGSLWEGMNVKVLIRKVVPGHLVVPKAAVVLRQNQEVLFKYSDGLAIWTYVQTSLENSSSYSVIAHPDKGGELHPGDTVIVSNNVNLAHESPVRIVNSSSHTSYPAN